MAAVDRDRFEIREMPRKRFERRISARKAALIDARARRCRDGLRVQPKRPARVRFVAIFGGIVEIDRLVYFWASQQMEGPDQLKMEAIVTATPSGTIGGHPRDPLLEQAKELARQYSEISTSFLQRKLHIGYPRAARLKEQLDAVLQEEAEAMNEEENSGEESI